MKAIKFAAILLTAAASVPLSVHEASAQVNQLDAEINIIPDKTVKTDDGIRISLCVVGIPHTSQRIDGVDFERYFQFEDSGVQTIEVDFPFSGTLPKTAKLIFHTANGDITAPARQ